MTVGRLRAALQGVPDDVPVSVSGAQPFRFNITGQTIGWELLPESTAPASGVEVTFGDDGDIVEVVVR